MFEEKVQEQKALAQMGVPPETGTAPVVNSALIPDDYVQDDVEKTLNSTPMQGQAELDPYMAQALVGSVGSEVM